MSKLRDKKIKALREKISIEKEALKGLDKPCWKTNCNITVQDSIQGNTVRENIHAMGKNSCITVMTHLVNMKSARVEALELLGLDAKGNMSYQGYSLNSWIEDVKLRFTIIDKKNRLKVLKEAEETLAKHLSPDAKVNDELSAITELLGL